jgi:hypothetical protein
MQKYAADNKTAGEWKFDPPEHWDESLNAVE